MKKNRKKGLKVIGACLIAGACIGMILNTKEETKLSNFTAKIMNSFVDSGEEVVNSWDISTNSDESVIATLYGDGRLVISGTGKMKEWSNTDDDDWHEQIYAEQIKKVIIESGINTIGRYAFINCVNLTNLEIPDTVTRIGAPRIGIIDSGSDYEQQIDANNLVYTVFLNCKNLESVNVDSSNADYSSIDGVLFDKEQTEIEYYPEGKKSETYSIPDTVTKIRKKAFLNAESLVDVEIPEGVEIIKDYAFENCTSITDIEIPSSVTWIGSSKMGSAMTLFQTVSCGEALAFSGCDNLVNINVNENNSKYSSENGILFNKAKTEILCYPAGKNETTYTIPNGVKSINGFSFLNCDKLTDIKISDDTTTIEGNAFENCTGLTSMEIPRNVTSIQMRTRNVSDRFFTFYRMYEIKKYSCRRGKFYIY